MIYVKTSDSEVGYDFIHNMPFHETYGLGKTRLELESEGVFVDRIPEPLNIDGKIPNLVFKEGKLQYEYYDIPPTTEERIDQLEQKFALELAESNTQMFELIMTMGVIE